MVLGVADSLLIVNVVLEVKDRKNLFNNLIFFHRLIKMSRRSIILKYQIIPTIIEWKILVFNIILLIIIFYYFGWSTANNSICFDKWYSYRLVTGQKTQFGQCHHQSKYSSPLQTRVLNLICHLHIHCQDKSFVKIIIFVKFVLPKFMIISSP